MQLNEEQAKQGIEQDLKAYKKLQKINKSEEFNDFFDLITKTAADKMVWAFTGDNIKSWDDFLKVRGEIISYLYPLQEVRSADAMAQHLKDQLDSYYNKQI